MQIDSTYIYRLIPLSPLICLCSGSRVGDDGRGCRERYMQGKRARSACQRIAGALAAINGLPRSEAEQPMTDGAAALD